MQGTRDAAGGLRGQGLLPGQPCPVSKLRSRKRVRVLLRHGDRASTQLGTPGQGRARPVSSIVLPTPMIFGLVLKVSTSGT